MTYTNTKGYLALALLMRIDQELSQGTRFFH